MAYPRNDDHFVFIFLFSRKKEKLFKMWQFVQKSTYKAAAVVGRPRRPLFTAARHCGTARNYFPPPVSVREERKNYTTTNNNTIKLSKTLNRSAAAKRNVRKNVINQ